MRLPNDNAGTCTYAQDAHFALGTVVSLLWLWAGRYSRRPRDASPTALAGGCNTERAVLLAALAHLVARVDAAGTICSNQPSVCAGTFTGTDLCAARTTPSVALHVHALG